MKTIFFGAAMSEVVMARQRRARQRERAFIEIGILIDRENAGRSNPRGRVFDAETLGGGANGEISSEDGVFLCEFVGGVGGDLDLKIAVDLAL